MTEIRASAIQYLKAIRVRGKDEAIPALYAYRPQNRKITRGPMRDDIDRYYVVEEQDLESAAARGSVAFGTPMPRWWSPELRYAVIAAQRSDSGVTCPSVSKEMALAAGVGTLVVTVNLETGEEVVAS